MSATSESAEDKNVDAVIRRMQALLDELKGAQAKDVQGESAEESAETDKPFQGKNLKEAEQEAFVRVRAHQRRRRAAQQAPGADAATAS